MITFVEPKKKPDDRAGLGDVIQIGIDPAHVERGFAGMLAVVDGVKSWGVTCRVYNPDPDPKKRASGGVYFPYRVSYGDFYRIGKAAIAPRDIAAYVEPS